MIVYRLEQLYNKQLAVITLPGISFIVLFFLLLWLSACLQADDIFNKEPYRQIIITGKQLLGQW